MGHHHVPQQYLKGFELPDEPGLIWMYDKKTDELRKTSIAAAAQARAFYDPETEQKLNELVEGPAQAALARLGQGEYLSVGDRRAVALYLSVMLMRVPAHRRKAQELIPPTTEDVIRQVNAALEEWAKNPSTDSTFVARRRLESERARARFLSEPPEEILGKVKSSWATAQVVDTVFSMTWRVVAAPSDNPFITGDNPAFFVDSLGVGRADSELVFPISPSLALVASWQGPARAIFMVPQTLSVVKEVNRRVAFGAERFVFSNEPSPWIPVLAKKARPVLKRMLWRSYGLPARAAGVGGAPP
jgi:hypothetical protein